MSQLALGGFAPTLLWSHVPIEDPRIAALADRHYSRQTIGARGAIAPGKRFAFHHVGPIGEAAWGVVYNKDPVGTYQWRNSLFRNESGTLSSTLIIAATALTYELWERRYRGLPTEPLRTEVAIEETRARRSKRNLPGHCYLMSGWRWVEDRPREHGRAAKAIFEAPDPATARILDGSLARSIP